MRYRGEVDGLRALAVIPVILFHAGIQTFSGGFVGVDVFFVISGYLITSILLNELESGSFSILNFYERRARRILPALFFVMFATLPFAWLWLTPLDLKAFSKSLIAVSSFSSNFLFWQESGYFDTSTELKPLIHTWSLAVEEQFYLLFPPFLFAIWSLGKRWVLALVSIATIVSLFSAELVAQKHAALAFYMLPTRAWELAIGSFVAFYHAQHNFIDPRRWIAQWGSLIGFVLIAFAVFGYNKDTPFPGFYALIPTVGTALIIAYATRETWVGTLLGGRYLVSIGLISYSAYLWHQPMFALARHRSLYEPTVGLMLALAVLSFIFSYFTWRFIESPFRKKDIFSRKQIFVCGAVGSIFFAAVGLFGIESNEHKNRELNGYKNRLNIFSGSRVSDGSCVKILGLPQLAEEICLTNSDRPTILFSGDSHAMALYSSIYGGAFNFPALLVSGHSCPIYPNLTYTPTYQHNFDNNCTEISNGILSVAKNIKSIHTIVLVNSFATIDEEKSRYRIGGITLNNTQAFETGYGYLIGRLIGLNKRVVLVVDVPRLKSKSSKCFLNPYGDVVADCRYTTEENAGIRKRYIAEINSLKRKFPDLVIYDPTNIFCDDAYCEIVKNGEFLYNDDHHLSVLGSNLLIVDMLHRGVIQAGIP